MKRFMAWQRWTDRDEAKAGIPFYLMLLLIMVAAYAMVLATDASMRRPDRWALFTLLMLAHAILHFLGARLAARPRWIPLYLLVQGVLVLAIGLLTQIQGLILGLYLAQVGETAGLLWPSRRDVAMAASAYIVLMVLNIVWVWGASALLQVVPMLLGMIAFVLIYVILYVRQVEAHSQAQKLLHELEIAHRQLQQYADQIEELTISRERQRMARELHDTLAQGLAGLILQLEAADSHLEAGSTGRDQAVVQQAMQRTRTTLQEARRAIQALRPASLEQDNLVDAIRNEVQRFGEMPGLTTTFQATGSPQGISPETSGHILRIVQESLTNVARHAQATHVAVRFAVVDGNLELQVQDNGVGFDPLQEPRRSGTFGLDGMQQRAERMGATLSIESSPGQGTKIILSVRADQR